mmetsp:Transcript_115549/g.331670  ORF Transcript_115549/g.331670 Transcript_115549/m.331670 type:complete len:89 (-) Transcript_115549:103-369(-)
MALTGCCPSRGVEQAEESSLWIVWKEDSRVITLAGEAARQAARPALPRAVRKRRSSERKRFTAMQTIAALQNDIAPTGSSGTSRILAP